MVEPQFHLYFDVIQTLERIQAPYVIIGAFAGVAYGVTRATFDVDIVVDLSEAHIQALEAAYPPPRFYADAHQMRDSIRFRQTFAISWWPSNWATTPSCPPRLIGITSIIGR